VMHLLRPIHEGDAFTEAHTEMVGHLLRPIQVAKAKRPFTFMLRSCISELVIH